MLFGFALVIRLTGSFYAQNTEADATSRVLLAEELRDHFRIIYSGHWPSLQYYFLAFFTWLFNDRVTGPLVLCVLLGSVSILPFYGFCKNLFSQKGAVFSSLVFTLCPVVLRNSFIPLSEIFYLFFTCFALYYLSEAWKKDVKKTKNSLKAGLFLTLAGGMRIEAWILIPLLCVPFLLNRDIKSAFYFGLTSSLFPVFWMAGNYIDYGDIFYSIHSVEKWNFNAEGHNEQIDKTEIFRRILFYPFSFTIMLTPLGVFLFLFYSAKNIITRNFTRNQWGLLIIFLLLCIIYLFQCVDGRLFMQHRFTITLVVFSIPFLGLLFHSGNKLKLKYVLSLVLIAGIIPWSYYWHYLPYSKVFFFSERLKNTTCLIIADSWGQTGAIPEIKNKNVFTIRDKANEIIDENDGWIVDFDGWENTYYLAQSVNARYNKIYIQEGAKNSVVDAGKLIGFLKTNPKGLIMLKDFGMLESSFSIYGRLMQINDSTGIELKKIEYYGHLRLFHYRFVEEYKFAELKKRYEGKKCLYEKVKDIEFFEERIRRDKIWLSSVIQKSNENKISIEEMIKRDAEYMVMMENQGK